MFYVLGIAAVVLVVVVLARRKPQQAMQREVLYKDGEAEIVVFNGISGLVNGEYWKAIFAFPVNDSILGKLGFSKQKLLLRIAQSPTEDAPQEGGLGMKYLKYELTIPAQNLKRSFQDLRYIDFNPCSPQTPGSIELMVDADVYRVVHQFSDPQASRVVETFREWLTKNTMKFEWEGISTKQEWKKASSETSTA